MTPEKAREYLMQYMNERQMFPIVDSIAFRMNTPNMILDITFVELLCIAYNLKPIDMEKQTPEDIIVTKVAMKYFDRSEMGIKKYGTTL